MAAGTVGLGRGVHWHMFRWWRQLCFLPCSAPSLPILSVAPSHNSLPLGRTLNTRQEVAKPASYSRSTGLWMELSHESLWACVFAPAAYPTLAGQMRKEGLKPQVLTVCGRVSYRKRPPCQHAGCSSAGVMLLATHEKQLLSYNAKSGDRWDHNGGSPWG